MPPSLQVLLLGTFSNFGQPIAMMDDCGRRLGNCDAWTYCEEATGCIDELGNPFATHGCNLKHEPLQPSGIPSPGLVERMRPTTFSSGYIKRAFFFTDRVENLVLAAVIEHEADVMWCRPQCLAADLHPHALGARHAAAHH